MDDKRFTMIFWFAVGAFACGIALLTGIIFGYIPKENQQMANVALGFVMNTLLATVLLYFFGGTTSKKNDTGGVTVTGDNPTVGPVNPSAPNIPADK